MSAQPAGISVESLGEPVVRVPDLRVIVPGSHTIVDGVEFELHPGEVLGLVGESGSGKTTVALALLGYARKGMELHGSAFVDGIDVIAASEAVRQDLRGRVVSYVPQDPSASLNPALRIGSQLRDRLRAHDRAGLDPDQRIADVLERMHLPTSREFLRRYPHQLSGGQVQRVCIALAVLCRPKVIVLDEPTTGLDVMTQARVLELVSSVIVAEHTAAVYVTHDLAVVAGLADRIAVMYSGLFMEEAAAETLLREPLHPYTRRLVQSTPSLHARTALVGIGGSPLNPKDREDACPFAARCDYATEACIERIPTLESLGGRSSGALRPGRRARGRRGGGRRPGAKRRLERPHRATTTRRSSTSASLCAFYGQTRCSTASSSRSVKGECLALVGESGSGKTTLGRCVSGLHVGGRRARSVSAARRSRSSPRNARRRLAARFNTCSRAPTPR